MSRVGGGPPRAPPPRVLVGHVFSVHSQSLPLITTILGYSWVLPLTTKQKTGHQLLSINYYSLPAITSNGQEFIPSEVWG